MCVPSVKAMRFIHEVAELEREPICARCLEHHKKSPWQVDVAAESQLSSIVRTTTIINNVFCLETCQMKLTLLSEAWYFF